VNEVCYDYPQFLKKKKRKADILDHGRVCPHVFPFFTHSMYHRSNARPSIQITKYEGWNFNSGNYLFTTDTK